jgi:anti-anti-sigma regulatory factor
MPSEAILIKIEDSGGLAGAMDRTAAQLETGGDELILDFASVRRIDSAGLRAMENLIRAAEEKAVKVCLRGVDVSVYKVLKLMKLAPRVSFMN